ncbi:MAG: helix-turn-helix domain-containing protein [Acidimicrobiales bacterium]|nr:helix-turn-helix domain-containing protein [Acidimicrobiales bacterium]
MREWTFLTNHAQALLFIAQHPDARLRDLADALDVTERTAYGLVADLTASGFVVKEKDGRRNRYHVREDRLLRDSTARERTVGDVLQLFAAATPQRRPARRG